MVRGKHAFALADTNEDTLQRVMEFCRAALDAAHEYDPSSMHRSITTCSNYIRPLYRARDAVTDAEFNPSTPRKAHVLRACDAIIASTERACKAHIEHVRNEASARRRGLR